MYLCICVTTGQQHLSPALETCRFVCAGGTVAALLGCPAAHHLQMFCLDSLSCAQDHLDLITATINSISSWEQSPGSKVLASTDACTAALTAGLSATCWMQNARLAIGTVSCMSSILLNRCTLANAGAGTPYLFAHTCLG